MITANLAVAEARRVEAQTAIDSRRTGYERNRSGQFATPPALAREITRFVSMTLCNQAASIHFSEPALGTGSFFSALLSVFSNERIASATGVELDPSLVGVARDLWGPFGLDVIEGDFTREETLARCSQRPNLILTNPPYVRHHHLTKEQKDRLRSFAARSTYLDVNGLAGLYVYFMLIAHAWLQDNGFAAWLVPSEFMDVNYGEVLRRYLTERVTLLALHRFDPSEVQFGDALVSSAVVIYQKLPPRSDASIRFSFGVSLLSPSRSQDVGLQELKRAHKWALFPGVMSETDACASSIGTPRLSDLFKIQRGLATGANEFFILTRAQACARQLPERFLQPILPSPRFLRSTIIESDDDGYPRLDDQLCLIKCDLPQEDVKRHYPALWDYFETVTQAGVLERYLLQKRQPWYRQETRRPAPFLCTYMGRGATDKRPFRFIWNQSRAVAPNVYHFR